MRPHRLTLRGEAFLSAGVRKFFRQSSGYASLREGATVVHHFFIASLVIETAAGGNLFQPMPAKRQTRRPWPNNSRYDGELQIINLSFEKPSLGFRGDEFERMTIGASG